MNDFDELFNDFMKNESNNKKDDDSNMMADLFKKLSNLGNIDNNLLINSLSENLGEPDEVKTFEENGIFFIKKIWNTKHGQIIKTILSDVPVNKKKTEKKQTKMPLEVQLENAVKEENYELAAKLRDRIIKRDVKKIKK